MPSDDLGNESFVSLLEFCVTTVRGENKCGLKLMQYILEINRNTLTVFINYVQINIYDTYYISMGLTRKTLCIYMYIHKGNIKGISRIE